MISVNSICLILAANPCGFNSCCSVALTFSRDYSLLNSYILFRDWVFAVCSALLLIVLVLHGLVLLRQWDISETSWCSLLVLMVLLWFRPNSIRVWARFLTSWPRVRVRQWIPDLLVPAWSAICKNTLISSFADYRDYEFDMSKLRAYIPLVSMV